MKIRIESRLKKANEGTPIRVVDDQVLTPTFTGDLDGVAMRGFTLWLTGLPCSGKSTLAELVASELRRRGHRVQILDGDIVRKHLTKGLGFSKEDRDANIRRIGSACQILSQRGAVAIAAAISPYQALRDEVRSLIANFIEVYVAAPLDVCIQRDVKGMYRKALAGEIKNFTGISDPYEPPVAPEVVLHTESESPEVSAAQIVAYLKRRGLLFSVSPAGISEAPPG